MPKVKADKVEKSFGNVTALKEVSVEAEEGEILGIIGPNGAGKSTLMKILTGQMERDSGEVEVMGEDPEGNADLRQNMGVLPEREDPPSFLTGKEFLDFCSEVREREAVEKEWIDRLNLTDNIDRLGRNLSKGERQKFMVAQAFFHDPDIVFIDEPMINLDPFMQEEVKEILRQHREDGGTVILSTHVVSLAEEICDRIVFLEEGEKSREIEKVENLREKFLDSE